MEKYTCSDEWVLENFNVIYNNYINVLTGRVFHTITIPNAYFVLNVKPLNGQKIGIWVNQFGPDDSEISAAEYDIYCLKTNNEKVKICSGSFENKVLMGYTEVLFNGLLGLNGELCICCKITMFYNHSYSMENTFYKMFKDKTFSDCVIKIGNETIDAHKGVLASNSEVFLNMFTHNTLESNKSELIIKDASWIPFNAMLEFFYCGKISADVLKEHVEDIFILADKYQVEPLKFHCELFMASRINNENIYVLCGEFLRLYQAPTLKKACISYLRKNKIALVNNEGWEQAKKKYQNLDIFLEYLEDE